MLRSALIDRLARATMSQSFSTSETGVLVMSAAGPSVLAARLPSQFHPGRPVTGPDLRTDLRVAIVSVDHMLVSLLLAWLRERASSGPALRAMTIDEVTEGIASFDVVVLDPSGQDPKALLRAVRAARAVGVPLVGLVGADAAIGNACGAAEVVASVSRRDDFAVLLRTVSAVAARRLSPAHPATAMLPEQAVRPNLSEQERAVLHAYVSGLTLNAAARKAGVKAGTAKVYLERVKRKYREVGRPAATKVELARRVFEDDVLSASG